MELAWPYQAHGFAISNSHMPCVVIESIFVCVMCLHELKKKKLCSPKVEMRRHWEVFAYVSAIPSEGIYEFMHENVVRG